MSALSTSAAICGVLLVASTVWNSLKKDPNSQLPPGPPADPIIGHLRILPTDDDRADVFHAWSLAYGDVFSLRALGKIIIVLNSEKAAAELLEKRGARYSDRPEFPIYKRVGWNDVLVFMPYGPAMVQQRKLMQSSLAKGTMKEYRPLQEREINIFLKNILGDPKDYDREVHRMTTALILNAAYGHHVESSGDEIFKMAENIVEILREGSLPSLLDISTIFEWLPAWFPGAWHTRYIQRVRPALHRLKSVPFEKARAETAAGSAQPSFLSRNFEEMFKEGRNSEADFEALKNCAHMILGGGADTMWHTITIFMACMLCTPDAQAKAQAEIDRVIGRGRLPDFTDRDSLPYVECVVLETMRWYPVVPFGIPHKALADDHYEGMYIPKGATVFANARSMTLDENKFYKPREFMPERFLPKPEGLGEEFPVNVLFGWGRRVCPGRYLADSTVWLALARFLAVFNITKSKDADGNVIEPVIRFVTGLSSHPIPFECDMLPRDEQAADLIREAYLTTESL